MGKKIIFFLIVSSVIISINMSSNILSSAEQARFNAENSLKEEEELLNRAQTLLY